MLNGSGGVSLAALFKGLVVIPLLAAPLVGCKPENKFIPLPPPQVSVATPLQQQVVPYTVQTGNAVAFNTVDLVARVEGFLTQINYRDGGAVKKGDLLFLIDPTTYEAKVKEAQAQLDAAKAALVQAEAEFTRQDTLLKQNVSAANTWDMAKAKRDADRANVEDQQANLVIAQVNLGYTKVLAPFDGVVTKHLISVGELVGNGVATKLATIVQLDPIYVTFNMSEQDVLQVRANMAQNRLTIDQLDQIPLDIGLMNEEGYPHKGHLEYVSPELDPMTGTILVRGLFQNPKRDLLPGFFARIQVPMGLKSANTLIVPSRVIAEDQAGSYLLVVNKDDVVEQRRIKAGQSLPGGLREITSGLNADDRVVLSTNGRAIPGKKVVPQAGTIAAGPASISISPK
jgi:membrane fusion protein, multidrug efflux system